MAWPHPTHYQGQTSAPRVVLPGVKLPKLLERDVLAQSDRLMEQTGWIVERYEQSRASRICEGLPDRRYVLTQSPGVCVRLWVEGKKPGGKLTRAQHAWLVRENEAGGLATVIDSVDVLARLLDYCRPGMPAGVLRAECAQLIALTAQRGFRAS
jgi:hypothetical protein